jgi:glycosyltransferase involved in cell wall biosynthesis
MTENNPKVSVGLAVFNGEKYLREAIDSILAQTFTDFELIISDNASTDRTAKICREYAIKDSRLRYYRNSVNIGGVNNENRTFDLSRGKYFHWAAHDDFFAPEFLTKCVEVLDRNPSVVLCYPLIVSIDEHGNAMGTKSFGRGTSKSPSERFRSLATIYHANEASYGLMRADILRENQLRQKNYTDSDRTFISALSLYGEFYEVPEPLFFKRFHSKNTYPGGLYRYARGVWFNPEVGDKIVYPPRCLQLYDFLANVNKCQLDIFNKLQCCFYLFIWLLQNGRELMTDSALFFYLLSRTPGQRKEIYNNHINWL